MKLFIAFTLALCVALPASAKPHRHKHKHARRMAATAEVAANHPRVLVTAADLPRLRSWATPANPWWADLGFLAGQAKTRMDANGLVPNDNGSYSISAVNLEQYAQLFAFMSLVDPDPANRADWARRAHDLIMVPINAAALGDVTTFPFTPFRDPRFPTGDRSRWGGDAFPLTVDWIYQTFSDAEKANILAVFTNWCHHLKTDGNRDASYPTPIDVLNDPRTTSTATKRRWSANNYYNARARNMAYMAACLDAADDPNDQLRGPYLRDFWGAWIYVISTGETQDYRGSMSPEGTEYGLQAQGNTALTVWALGRAGLADPGVYGPQTSLLDTAFWQNYPKAVVSNLSPSQMVNPLQLPGPTYAIGEYGDTRSYYGSKETIFALGALALHAQDTGDVATVNACRYIELNMQYGGAGYRHKWNRAMFSIATPTTPVMLFLLFDPNDPNSAAPIDPRPSYPTDFVSPGLTRIMSRTDWGPNADWVIFHAPWNQINHQIAAAGKVEFWRKGEWLTMGRPGYGMEHDASDNQNSLSLQSTYRSNLSWPYPVDAAHGSQWLEVSDADPVNVYSLNPAYTYLQTEMTGLYRSTYAAALDVTQANRSVMWLKPDFILVYDRAKSSKPNQFKREEWGTPTLPVISGNVATATNSPSGQHLYITSVLPAGATLTPYDPKDMTSPYVPPEDKGWGGLAGEQEDQTPMHYRVRIEDATNPQTMRWLTVLQGADAGTVATTPVAFASTSGTAFDGVTIGGIAVLFAQDPSVAFAGTSFPWPAGAATVYLTGLLPGTGYTVTQSAGVATVAAGGPSVADSGGVLAIQQQVQPPPPPDNPPPVIQDVQTLFFGLASKTPPANSSVLGVVLLAAPAPAGGTTIALSSSGPAVVPPASVTIAAGKKFLNVQIPTGAAGTATVTATLGRQSVAWKVTVK